MQLGLDAIELEDAEEAEERPFSVPSSPSGSISPSYSSCSSDVCQSRWPSVEE